MLGKLNVLGSDKKTQPDHKEFKRITCLLKEEEYLIDSSPPKKRWKFTFITLKNDMGFGSSTGDLVESVVIYSMSPDRFETGKKYTVELKEV